MIDEQRFSDEFLNAFVDNQLAPEEKSDAFLAISRDEALNRRVCELRKVRDLVQLACAEPPAPARPRAPSRDRRWRRGLQSAAALVLGLGLVLGWGLQRDFPGPGPRQSALTAETPLKGIKVMLHLNSGDPQRMAEALDDAEELLRYYRSTHQIARVEIITNGGGINLLRADTSPYKERIRQLYRDWNNLVFVACQNALDRVKREQGKQIELLPEAVVIDSAVAQIMRRQHQGWAYIQV